MSDELLTAKQAADMLKLKENTVYRMISRGDLPSIRRGRRFTRIRRSDLEAFIDNCARARDK